MMGFGHGGFGLPYCGPRHCGPPVRYCRREAKELLVVPAPASDAAGTSSPQGVVGLARSEASGRVLTEGLVTNAAAADRVVSTLMSGEATAVIGGGCCVELAVEYMPVPTPGSAPSADVSRRVLVQVIDSEGTTLRWTKEFSEGYHVKEAIIVTFPGATLNVRVRDAIARVRWCEVFSC